MVPVRLTALLEDYLRRRLHGEVTVKFADGAVVLVTEQVSTKLKDLPTPRFIEPTPESDASDLALGKPRGGVGP